MMMNDRICRIVEMIIDDDEILMIDAFSKGQQKKTILLNVDSSATHA
jgi:hypothetical protein